MNGRVLAAQHGSSFKIYQTAMAMCGCNSRDFSMFLPRFPSTDAHKVLQKMIQTRTSTKMMNSNGNDEKKCEENWREFDDFCFWI
jgi:hypothetical protein